MSEMPYRDWRGEPARCLPLTIGDVYRSKVKPSQIDTFLRNNIEYLLNQETEFFKNQEEGRFAVHLLRKLGSFGLKKTIYSKAVQISGSEEITVNNELLSLFAQEILLTEQAIGLFTSGVNSPSRPTSPIESIEIHKRISSLVYSNFDTQVVLPGAGKTFYDAVIEEKVPEAYEHATAVFSGLDLTHFLGQDIDSPHWNGEAKERFDKIIQKGGQKQRSSVANIVLRPSSLLEIYVNPPTHFEGSLSDALKIIDYKIAVSQLKNIFSLHS